VYEDKIGTFITMILCDDMSTVSDVFNITTIIIYYLLYITIINQKQHVYVLSTL